MKEIANLGKFNAKNGAKIGLTLGSIGMGVAFAVKPELRDLPLEDLVSGTTLVIATITTEMAIAGYLTEKCNKYVISPLLKYLSNNKY